MISRVLSKDEWSKLGAVNGLPQIGPTMPADDAKIVVVEDEGRIVCTVGVLRVTHLESLWIDPEYRGNVGMARRMLREAVKAARTWPDKWAWGCSDTAHMSDIILRVGGVKLPVESFMIHLEGA